MTQGESSQEKIYDAIFAFLLQNAKPTTAKEIRAHCDCAKATFYKYLNQLYSEGRVECIPKRGIGKDEYKITTKWSNEMRKKLNLQPLNRLISWKEIEETFENNEKLKRKLTNLENQESALTTEQREDLLELLRLIREGKVVFKD